MIIHAFKRVGCGLPSSHFPPTQFPELGGQAGMDPRRSSRASLPLLSQSPGIPASACLKQLSPLRTLEKAPCPSEAFPVNSFSFLAWNSSQSPSQSSEVGGCAEQQRKTLPDPMKALNRYLLNK